MITLKLWGRGQRNAWVMNRKNRQKSLLAKSVVYIIYSLSVSFHDKTFQIYKGQCNLLKANNCVENIPYCPGVLVWFIVVAKKSQCFSVVSICIVMQCCVMFMYCLSLFFISLSCLFWLFLGCCHFGLWKRSFTQLVCWNKIHRKWHILLTYTIGWLNDLEKKWHYVHTWN